ncbi:unnamed protein product, partial [Laminaria digitata]
MSSKFEVDLTGLAEGTGQWENMQGVIRRTFKGLLDTQATQRKKMATYDKQLRQTQALVVATRKLASDKAAREDAARTAAATVEIATAVSKLRGELSTMKEDARTEASELVVRLE